MLRADCRPGPADGGPPTVARPGVPPSDAPSSSYDAERVVRHLQSPDTPSKVRDRAAAISGFAPTLVIEAVADLPGSTTTENGCCSGPASSIACIQRRKRPIPVHIKTLDCPVAGANGSLLTCGDGRPVLMRCVRESRRLRESRGHLTWEFIEYTVRSPRRAVPAVLLAERCAQPLRCCARTRATGLVISLGRQPFSLYDGNHVERRPHLLGAVGVSCRQVPAAFQVRAWLPSRRCAVRPSQPLRRTLTSQEAVCASFPREAACAPSWAEGACRLSCPTTDCARRQREEAVSAVAARCAPGTDVPAPGLARNVLTVASAVSARSSTVSSWRCSSL